MKKLLYILLLLPTLVFGQSGDGYVNYKSYKTHYGNGNSSTYNGYTYSGLAGDATELQAMLDVNHPGTSLTHQGEVLANSAGGFQSGRPPRWRSEYYGVYHYGWFQAQETGTYSFSLQSDDGSGLWIDGDLKLFRPCCGISYVDVSLTSGQWYFFETKWQEYQGGDYMFLKYSPPSTTNYYYPGQQTSSLKVTNIEPTEEPIDPSVDLDLEFHSQLAPEEYRFRVYYDGTSAQDGTEWLNTSTMNSSYYLDDDGSKDITDYLNLVKMANGKKATTTGGNVEWCVVYDYDNTNKRYRVGIDKREFPSGVSSSDVKQLQLFDVWDGDVTFKSDDGTWGEYYIYTDTQLDFTNSTSSTYIRDANGFYGMRAEFSFEDVEIYKGHKISFMNPSNNIEQWTAEEFMDDYITVADVVAGFNELAGGGINGGYKGDLSGVQLQNSDVNQDGEFDFQDSQIGLSFLTGGETPFNGTLSEIMRIVPKSEYDNTTTTNWKTQTTKSPSTSFTFSLIDTIQTLEYKVSFIGDVNLSHSAPQTGTSPATQSTISSRMMSVRNSSTQKNTSLEVDLDIEKTNENIIVTLCIPENNFNIIGSEFRIGFDDTRVTYDRLETNSNLQNFDAKRTNYIKLGSISTDGSLNLNGGVEYKLYFSPQQNFDSILGLVSVIKSELVTKEGIIIESRIK
jgi:hypothetical protein